jgi:hypothetical protein
MVAAGANEYTITFTLGGRANASCENFYLLATLDSIDTQQFAEAGTHTLTWKTLPSASVAEQWDFANKGVRLYAATLAHDSNGTRSGSCAQCPLGIGSATTRLAPFGTCCTP